MGVLNEPDDLRKRRIAPDAGGLHDKAARPIEGGTYHLIAHRSGDRHAFAGKHGFVHAGTAFKHGSVDRDARPRPDPESIPYPDGGNGNPAFEVTVQQDCLRRLQ